MATHLTVRLAWHDNNWDGKVCSNPEKNVYCTGTHSLLSERIARNKNIELESLNHGKKLDALGDYIPPCFWSSNAFSSENCKIRHEHPFNNMKVSPINETLKSYSVFTWPFRLSFNHSKEKQKREGSYPPDLERRIREFIDKFDKGESIIFYYLNYDNPISAEESKYVLVGCSLLKDKNKENYFEFSDNELEKIKRNTKMKNFPTINWAQQFNLDFKDNGILLPYKEYLDHIDQNPEHDFLLDEMKVLIAEESLISSFKYVAMDIDDDKALYLLYKLKKSISIIQDHIREYGFFDRDFKREEEIINKLIEKTWKNRGLYPSLKHVIDIMLDSNENEKIGEKLISRIQENLSLEEDLLYTIFDLIQEDDTDIPEYLVKFSAYIEDLRDIIEDYEDDEIKLLQKLSLFSLTRYQIERILRGDDCFKKLITPSDIVSNPYILCENYIPEELGEFLDEIEIIDDLIDVFKIDIGMFPDSRFLKKNRDIQNLSPKSPERLRALMINYLYFIGQYGDCYSNLDDIFNFIIQFPLFYKDKEQMNIQKTKLISKEDKYYPHFINRLTIIESKGEYFFYLNEVYRAEVIVKDTIIKLLKRIDYNVVIDDLKEFIDKEKEELKAKIEYFDTDLFVEERTRLLENVLKKSFYVITGKPGSGKTHALNKIVREIEKIGETVTLLAPTGKAALRLKEEVEGKHDPQTIDRFIYRLRFADFLEDFENIILKKDKEKIAVDNLIIDESSMIDLQKMATLFSMFDLEGTYKIKRIIFVGDEYQLPPIGFGKPFFDIVQFLKSDQNYYTNNFTKLVSNCRQENDLTILQLADIFAEKNRYFDELLEKVSSGGVISRGLTVDLWESTDDLYVKIETKFNQIFEEEVPTKDLSQYNKNERLNILFGLTQTGIVKHKADGDFLDLLDLDIFQILSPYRAGDFGTLGLNTFIQSEYRERDDHKKQSNFYHSDKIIRTLNWYTKNRPKNLLLSNGSIGVINNDGPWYRKYYFLDQPLPFKWIDDEGNFELAYAITIHKSQGSDFKNVFLVIPNKKSLLSKELLYTALTRSTFRIHLLLQKNSKENNLEVAKKRSFVLPRNTSIFELPQDSKKMYEPEKGIFVQSKVEYIIFKYLKEAKEKGIIQDFKYEEVLSINELLKIKPDFTIYLQNGKKYFWEHLGMLDLIYYSKNWGERRGFYEAKGYSESLITTDDSNGIKEEFISKIIADIKNGNLIESQDNKFSNHHYRLY